MKRVLPFLGWAVAGFFFVGTFAVLSVGAITTAIGLLVWGLIFVPPLFRLTSRFGLFLNIGLRALLFFLMPEILPPIEIQEVEEPNFPSPTVTANPTQDTNSTTSPTFRIKP